MEHLTKQQIVLLTLFTTFVTSIATGIVTVSLMDQAPVGVTGTVEQVIERTVNQVASNGEGSSNGNNANSAASANAAGYASGILGSGSGSVANATALVQKSLVRIKSPVTSKISGLGIVVSKAGLVVTDKSAVDAQGSYVAVMPDGRNLPVAILQSQNNGDIVFLLVQQAGSTTPEIFDPATLAALSGTAAPDLGETVAALSGAETATVDQGIIKKIVTDASSTPTSYVTDINPSETLIGSPLFDLSGAVIGIKTYSLEAYYAQGSANAANATDAYYPVALLRAVIPVLTPAK